MLNKLTGFIRKYKMVQPGDTVICAVSGGADSVALLFGLYLLKEKLEIRLEAAHFNHHLRGEESCRDAAFVREFCDRYDIPLHTGEAEVKAGKKGLEAAARDARYAFLRSIPGKIATAHTADDNAETVLLHLIRGSGLKGLGGIAPVNGNLIRPMLNITRAEVEAFLEAWCLRHIEDSSNDTDAYLRNRIRHHVMPLLKAENPRLAENLSAMAQRLRLDEEYLSSQADFEVFPTVDTLKSMAVPIRCRALEQFLKKNGVLEPEQSHIMAAEQLVFSDRPSARIRFPGGVSIARNYNMLEVVHQKEPPGEVVLSCPGETEFGDLLVCCTPAEEIVNTADAFTVQAEGQIRLRSRCSGDEIRLSGGTKSLKKLFIDRKIPASNRPMIPVACDDRGILGAYQIGPNLDRTAQKLPAVTIRFIRKEK